MLINFQKSTSKMTNYLMKYCEAKNFFCFLEGGGISVLINGTFIILYIAMTAVLTDLYRRFTSKSVGAQEFTCVMVIA